MVWKGTDICCLLSRYLQCWMEHYFKDLVAEMKDVYNSHLNHNLGMKRNIVRRCLLIWCFEVRFNLQFTDGVHGGGVLSLDASTGVPGHSVLECFAWETSRACSHWWVCFFALWWPPSFAWLGYYCWLCGTCGSPNSGICGALLIHCSGTNIFFAMVCPVHVCAMVCPVHVCAMVLLCWPTTWQVELWIEIVYVLWWLVGWLLWISVLGFILLVLERPYNTSFVRLLS